MGPKINVKKFSRDRTIAIVSDIIDKTANHMTQPTNPVITQEIKAPLSEEPIQNQTHDDTIPEQTSNEIDSDDDFLLDLHNDKFVSEIETEKQEKERQKKMKEQEAEERKSDRLKKKAEIEQKKQSKAEKLAKPETATIVNDDGEETVLYGKDRWMLIRKVEQYKVLFPENTNIKKLKMKKNASLEELQGLVSECEAIIETDTVENFLTDAILTSIKAVEFASIRTRYNLNGLSHMLRENTQFNLLIKQLYLKYKVFAKIPVEMQLMMVVGTSAWICMEKNKSNSSNETFLNKSVNMSDFN